MISNLPFRQSSTALSILESVRAVVSTGVPLYIKSIVPPHGVASNETSTHGSVPASAAERIKRFLSSKGLACSAKI